MYIKESSLFQNWRKKLLLQLVMGLSVRWLDYNTHFQTGAKTILFGAAHAYKAHIKNYKVVPPPENIQL